MPSPEKKGTRALTGTIGSETNNPPISSDRVYIPLHHPRTLADFRAQEGRDNRKRKLQELWKSLPDVLHEPHNRSQTCGVPGGLTPEMAERLQEMYDRELLNLCATPNPSGAQTRHIGWKKFKEFAEKKEIELWHIFHDELDLDGNGHLDTYELHSALRKAGVAVSLETVTDFILSLTSEPHSCHVNFADFRDFFILLPRKVSPVEIYQYYEVRRYMGDDGRGPARVNMEGAWQWGGPILRYFETMKQMLGDVSLSAEDKPPEPKVYKVINPTQGNAHVLDLEPDGAFDYLDDDDDVENYHILDGHPALKFLLAGGIAGAVSRTCTAPFDRLKVFLITRPPEHLNGTTPSAQIKSTGIKVMINAITRLYAEGGFLAFWVGNGLSVAKVFPESAIKFFSYESAKRTFAKYVDKVEDVRDISGTSRFLSGGIGGISSQLSIYPIETLKTQMMSNTGEQQRNLPDAIRHLWKLGKFRAYYRGLSIGLVGVFPYSAIDMSTFEALKLAYQRSTGLEDSGVLSLLAFGSLSGSVGATSVYPLNLVRTRLQASGSPGHPQIYTGVLDVIHKTWEREGIRGFYRGLLPTLGKVVPSVSISYVVYDYTKRKLGIET